MYSIPLLLDGVFGATSIGLSVSLFSGDEIPEKATMESIYFHYF